MAKSGPLSPSAAKVSWLWVKLRNLLRDCEHKINLCEVQDLTCVECTPS